MGPKQLLAVIKSVQLVNAFFRGDQVKTAQWFEAPNPMFGGISALDLLSLGRVLVVLKSIETALDNNVNITLISTKE